MQKRNGQTGPEGVQLGINLPEIIAQMVWVRQIRCKVEETASSVRLLLGDLDMTKQFLADADEFKAELVEAEKDKARPT